jgi:hypothetical protein
MLLRGTVDFVVSYYKGVEQTMRCSRLEDFSKPGVNRLAGIKCGCSATSSFLTHGVSNVTFALHSPAFLEEPLTHSRNHRVRLKHEASSLAELCSFPSERQKRYHHSRHWDEQGSPVTELC